MRSAVLGAVVLGAAAAPQEQLAATCARNSSSWACTTGAWSSSSWTARAAFRASQNETGWATLFVESAASAEDDVQAYTAGYVEGLLTAQMMYDGWTSLRDGGLVPSSAVQLFVRDQMEYMYRQVEHQSSGTGPEATYWKSVGGVLKQYEGMVAGYEAARQEGRTSAPALTADELLWVGMNVELGDIQSAVQKDSRKDFEKMSTEEFMRYVQKTGHCSALFRVTPDLTDMLAAHTTWSDYIWMLRIFKTYTLRLSSSKAETVTFSGYPATIASIDDFFITSQKLVVIETTNDIFNNSLYDYIVPQTVPYWVRVTVATRVADSGKEWHDTFYLHNSGTYSNQWMVGDYKKFTPKSPLLPWTFSVSEQLPGPFSHPGTDMTDVLQRGHWPSYNVAYFPDVYNLSGYPEMVKKHGYGTSYQLAPRAPIFRRDADKVNSLDGMQRFIRENNYGTQDPLAEGGPCHAIACRADLELVDPSADGAIDAKITNLDFINAMSVSAISGPTTEKQPPFAFTGRWSNTPHAGMPTHWDFEWQIYSPSRMGAEGDSMTPDVMV